MEELLGMLRAEHAILQCRKADALGQNNITELPESDNEDNIEGYNPTYRNHEACLPSSPDSPPSDAFDSSDPDSDSEEYPATTSYITAKAKAAAFRIRQTEEFLGMLRAEHAILQRREADAALRIGQARDALNQNGITEFSESDNDDDVEGYNPTYHNDKAHFPPSSGLPPFDACGSSDSNSDSEEYPATVSQISAGASAAIKEADGAGHWDVHRIHSNTTPPQRSPAVWDGGRKLRSGPSESVNPEILHL